MIIENGKWKVYAHINKINGKIYIGITSREVNKRWKNGKGYDYNTHFYNAIQKYGWSNFDHEIIAANLTEEEAKNFERLMIEKLDTTNYKYGYNNDKGGGMPPVLFGENNPFYNVVPQKAVEASVKARIGKHLKEEHKQKIAKALINKHSKKVLCVETGIIYPSFSEAERMTGNCHANIHKAIKNNTRCGNCHWQYAT